MGIQCYTLILSWTHPVLRSYKLQLHFLVSILITVPLNFNLTSCLFFFLNILLEANPINNIIRFINAVKDLKNLF